MYEVALSPHFIGMYFSAAVEVCFLELGLLLVAISVKSLEERRTVEILVNPTDLPLDPSTMCAFVLGASERAARCLATYNAGRPQRVSSMTMAKRVLSKASRRSSQSPAKKFSVASPPPVVVSQPEKRQNFQRQRKTSRFCVNQAFEHPIEATPHVTSQTTGAMQGLYYSASGPRLSTTPTSSSNTLASNTRQASAAPLSPPSFTYPRQVDRSGTFHWVPHNQSLASTIIISKEQCRKHNFKGHIVVCVLANKHSPPVGLTNFLMPLRLVSIPRHELKVQATKNLYP